MIAHRFAGALALAAALSLPAVAGTLTAGPRLDVPYVPQSGVLCGGAALAMVLRWWGEPRVLAEDFRSLVGPGQAGIPADTLAAAARARGWNAEAIPMQAPVARDHLSAGRPLIVLVLNRAGDLHYVVLTGWTDGQVSYHDPQTGPFRRLPEAAFARFWAGSGNWALLVTPSPSSVPPPAPEPVPAAGSVSPWLVAASARFRAGDWAGAADMAERALAAGHADTAAWRLLAGSRFLNGQVGPALRAWNQLGEPRLDLLRIDGLERLRYAQVAAQTGLSAGQLLTPDRYRRARRRLAEMPTVGPFRMELRPRAGGFAQVDVALLERPLVEAGLGGAARAMTRAAIDREAVVDLAGATGNGELLTATWRWWAHRPLLSLAVAVAAPAGRPGLWRLTGSRETESHATGTASRQDPGPATVIVREDRRRLSLSRADWVTADLRLDVAAAVDSWNDRGSHLALSGGLLSRRAGERLQLDAEVGGWRGLRRAGSFAVLRLRAAWDPGLPEAGSAWLASFGLQGATRDAPRAVWPGAGTGTAREPLLRAHPLLADGVIDGRVFGRRLAHLTIERRSWQWRAGPVPCGWALFLDAAAAGGTERPGPACRQVDVGVGLRWRLPGTRGSWRLDFAHGLLDRSRAVSAAWQAP